MGLWKKICIGFIGLSCVASGCTVEESQKKQAPIQATETAGVYYDETSRLVNEVARLSEELFPNGGVIDLGKNNRGNGRYASINVNKNKRVLDTIVYIGVDEALERKLERLLSNRNYVAASRALNESGFEVTQFYDSDFNGFRIPDDTDFIRMKNGTEMPMLGNNLADPEFTKGYESILRTIKPYLEERLKKAGKQ